MIPSIENYFRSAQREERFAEGLPLIETHLEVKFPTDYSETVLIRGSWLFDHLHAPYESHVGRDYFSLTELLAVPDGDWVGRLVEPDTEIDGPGMCNGFRVLAYLDWVTLGGWWPYLVPIIYSDGFGFLAYDFRYSKEAPPIIAVSYEMFDLPSDAGFEPPTYVADSFTDLLLSAERQDPITGKFPSEGLPISPPPGAAAWEAQRDLWLGELEAPG